MVDPEPSKTDEKKTARSAEQPQQTHAVGELRAQVPAEIRDVSFPSSVRGYDRRAVDAYINRVNRVIAELEVSRSPQSAVRHALDRVAEQTKMILQQARESAEKITAAARQEGDDILAAAKAEAAEHLRRSQEVIAALQNEAEARMNELQADTEAISHRREELLAEMQRVAAQLQEVAASAASRFSIPEPPAADDATQVDRAPRDGSTEHDRRSVGTGSTRGPGSTKA